MPEGRHGVDWLTCTVAITTGSGESSPCHVQRSMEPTSRSLAV